MRGDQAGPSALSRRPRGALYACKPASGGGWGGTIARVYVRRGERDVWLLGTGCTHLRPPARRVASAGEGGEFGPRSRTGDKNLAGLEAGAECSCGRDMYRIPWGGGGLRTPWPRRTILRARGMATRMTIYCRPAAWPGEEAHLAHSGIGIATGGRAFLFSFFPFRRQERIRATNNTAGSRTKRGCWSRSGDTRQSMRGGGARFEKCCLCDSANPESKQRERETTESHAAATAGGGEIALAVVCGV